MRRTSTGSIVQRMARQGTSVILDGKSTKRVIAKKHIVLMVAEGEVWQQVVAFLRSCRQDFLPFLHRIHVLTPTLPPMSIQTMFDEVKK